MNCVSWNVRGLGRPEKKRSVLRFLKRENFVFMALQETKLKELNSRLFRWLWGNEDILAEGAASDGNSGGLISFWRPNFFTLESKIVSNRYVLLVGTVVGVNLRCGFGNIYAPNDDAEREVFWAELQSVIVDASVPWMLMGDFNVVRSAEEKIGMTLNQAALNVFSDFIENLGLIDLPLVGGKFTWCSNREMATVCRLDRFLVAPELLNAFPDLVQRVWPKALSDHNPVSLGVERKNWGPSPFKFYSHWLDMDGFAEFVKDKWDGIQECMGESISLWDKLRNLKGGIKNWVKRNGIFDARTIVALESKIHNMENDAINNRNWELMRVEIMEN